MEDNTDDVSDSDMAAVDIQVADSTSDNAEASDESKYDSEVHNSSSSVSFVENSDDDDSSLRSLFDEPQSERPLSEKEIEELIVELLEVESKAAEAQESLEEESIAKLEIDVRKELSETLEGETLDDAVEDEIFTFKEEWETVLDDLETQSANLLEQLDGAGVELPALYKWIESQAPNGCCTETWKNRTLWAGSDATSDVKACIANAEKCLQSMRPMRRLHGKLLEEGASGFLLKKLAASNDKNNMAGCSDMDWGSFNKIISSTSSKNEMAFGSKHWAFVYLASTPQQAAELGLKFPGADQVEEIDDIDGNSPDPFVADALANENAMKVLLPKNTFRKVNEEYDLNAHRRHQLRLKQKRHKLQTKKEVPAVDNLPVENSDTSNHSSKLPEPNQIENLIEKSLRYCNIEDEFQNEKAAFSECSTCDFDMDKQTTKISIADQDSNTLELPDIRGSKRTNCGDAVTLIAPNNFFCGSDTENNAFNHSHGYNESLSLQGSRASVEVDISVEDTQKKFRCTVCDILVVEVHQHPLLKVIICKNCKIIVEDKANEKVDHDCYEGHCGWCGRTSDLLSCKSCKVLFCSVCLKKNIGEGILLTDGSSRCFWCSPHLLEQLSLELDVAVKGSTVVVSSSDSDSDSSVRVLNNQNGVFKKRKKKIRRILDDAELGEDTKKKIAIEKERQDHLKSLQAQFSAKPTIMNNLNCKGHMPEGATVDVLGDVTTGYIVNVVRDKGENAVRIPPSISAKLKAHQISGIRFMWENIVQSIGKMKSGDKGLGCILAHTMGLGKTFQVITFLYVTMRCVDLALRTALIVVPINVLHNWRHEFIKWRPMELKPLRVYMLEDVSRERRFELLAKWRAKGGVFLIGYSAFRNLSIGSNLKDRDVAKNFCSALQDGPDILVCDEAHIIKNTKADTTQALKLVKCQRRIALTGSPLQNNLMEYYCMVDFVREGFLGSSHEFRNRFQNPIENGQHTNSTSMDVKIMNQRSHILYEQLKGFVQRMDVNVAKKDLPPKTVYVIAVKLSALQRKLYKKCLSVHGFTSHKPSDERTGKRNFFAGYQALAQIWNHPAILQLKHADKNTPRREETVENFHIDDISSDDNIDYNTVVGDKLRNKSEFFHKNCQNIFQEVWWNDLLDENNYNIAEYSGKMVLLLDILMHCSELGDKTLVFSQSIPTLDLIEIYLSRLRRKKRDKFWKSGKDWFRIDGRTVGSERQKLVELFNDTSNKRVKCTLISTKAGSLGINLHAANRVIIVDGSWNPTYDLQAIYRAWRYGQKKPVFAYRLLAHGTMEEKIYNRQVTKEGLAARVVDRQQVYRTMSKEDIRHLFDFGDDENPETLGGLEKDNVPVVDHLVNGENGNLWKQKLQLHGNCVSDKLMENLLSKHRPRWIANYHEHETMLQENEEEKLSKEEQDMAWEVYRKSLEYEAVQQQQQQQQQWIIDDSTTDRQRPEAADPYNPGLHPEHHTPCPGPDPDPTPEEGGRHIFRNRTLFRHMRKCTNLSHMLTLRSQGTKAGCRTVCGACAREISWDDPNRDGKAVGCAPTRDVKMST